MAESLILPAAIAMTRAMHGEKIASMHETIPVSNDTLASRIGDMANNINGQLIDQVMKSGRSFLQFDKSAEVSSDCFCKIQLRAENIRGYVVLHDT